MINTLKRKKPATSSSTRIEAKETKNVPSRATKSRTQSSVTSDLNIPPKSLEHLIDRPYVEYNSEKDDISNEQLSGRLMF
jgi:hypothetical protein